MFQVKENNDNISYIKIMTSQSDLILLNTLWMTYLLGYVTCYTHYSSERDFSTCVVIKVKHVLKDPLYSYIRIRLVNVKLPI